MYNGLGDQRSVHKKEMEEILSFQSFDIGTRKKIKVQNEGPIVGAYWTVALVDV